jgi:hypothetical protein
MTVEEILGFFAVAVPVILTSGVVAAIVTVTQNRWLEHRRAQEAERTRLRQSFAEAFTAYASYKEFPYAIRRRRIDQEADERARLSAELSAIQGKLSYYRAWTQFESPSVGEAYAALLTEMRRIAGGAMRDAWAQPPSQNDQEMNIPIETIDLRALTAEEDKFIKAVAARLDKLTPRRLVRH